ncbi:MAG TPA: hypothetical protein VJ973_00955 [Christiangramia sp.]|nr:hypothetical protein [Christiangramia sp.]
MSHKVKVFLIYFFSFIIIFTVSRYLIGLLIPGIDHLYLMIGAAIITVILSPRLDKDQNGRYVLKSVFRKEPLIK